MLKPNCRELKRPGRWRSGTNVDRRQPPELFVLALIIFAVAFGLRRTFFGRDAGVLGSGKSRNRSGRWALHFRRARSRISPPPWPGSTFIAAGALRLIRRRAAQARLRGVIDGAA